MVKWVGGGNTTVNYTPPPVQKDDSFQQFLNYYKDREKILQDRADRDLADEKAATASKNAAGAAAYPGFLSNIESQLGQGLISYKDAESQIRDFTTKYNMAPPEADIGKITKLYTQELLPSRQSSWTDTAFEEILGRKPTEDEKKKYSERFKTGVYGNAQELREALAKTPEYTKKFNQSYLDNFYDTEFGKQTVDEKGERTGKRTFTFAKNLLPTYGGQNLSSRTSVATPDFGDSFTGTPAEIQEQLQNVRDTRQYLYSAGLTNLQGEIDKETQKLKNEGSKEIAEISKWGSVMSSALSGFWG